MIQLFVFLLFPIAIFSQEFPTTLVNEEWVIIAPYILPDTHPAMPMLDKIFLNGDRPIRTVEALKKAGFKIITKGHWSDTIIATHPGVEGHFFKLFTEDQAHIYEVGRLYARIKGAELAQAIVDNHGFNKLFKVPRKWFYMLPDDPTPTFGIPAKRLILVAEDMRLLTKEENYRKWSASTLSKTLLESVFLVLTEGGFSDSSYAFNLPFAKDGRIALIDNDKYNKRPIPFHKLFKYLHPKLKRRAEQLIHEAGPTLAF